jgi:hypothetical protein
MYFKDGNMSYEQPALYMLLQMTDHKDGYSILFLKLYRCGARAGSGIPTNVIHEVIQLEQHQVR